MLHKQRLHSPPTPVHQLWTPCDRLAKVTGRCSCLNNQDPYIPFPRGSATLSLPEGILTTSLSVVLPISQPLSFWVVIQSAISLLRFLLSPHSGQNK